MECVAVRLMDRVCVGVLQDSSGTVWNRVLT